MTRLILLVIFLLYMIMVASSVSDEVVGIQLLPFAARTELPMGTAVGLAALAGMAAVMVVGLAEWISLRTENGKLRREIEQVNGEVESLRNMMIMERDAE